jgi:hypothetical protein
MKNLGMYFTAVKMQLSQKILKSVRKVDYLALYDTFGFS